MFDVVVLFLPRDGAVLVDDSLLKVASSGRYVLRGPDERDVCGRGCTAPSI